eukprot:CCRYP_013622-RB/>CCRYP_013622-RB protein AED:0.10 eAED:0.10 QI:294/1/1/1/0.5/0.66/3/1600/175
MAIKPTNNGILSCIGFTLSAYSVYVEYKIEHRHDDNAIDGEEFKALCDIESIGASCSTVFSLPEGKMLSFFGVVPSGHFLDIPNGVLGMIFYSYIFLRHITSSPLARGPLSSLFHSPSNLIICSLAFASSLFLGRKLYLIKEICVLCLTTHILNTTLFYRALTEFFSKSGVAKHD